MKKITCFLFLSVLLFSSVFAKENLLSFTVGLSSGIPFVGSEEIKKYDESVEGNNRVIIGSFGYVNLNALKQVTFFTGADMLCDFHWGEKDNSNHLHVAFPLGIKIFPGLDGLNLGLAYTLGFRADFINTKKYGRITDAASWGNGFKILMEYDFAHDGESQHLPTLGCSWNLMPRGNYTYDNILAFYFGFNF